MTWFLSPTERQALRLSTKMMRLSPRSLALAIFLGSTTLTCAIGLAVLAAWLIARASQPAVIWFDLAVAATSVRMFGTGRAVSRYLERLASHKVALSGVANLRHSLYRYLALADSSQVAALRRGDILARVGADVDAVGDYVVKSLLPALVTAIMGLATVILFAFFSPWAALSLALCLLMAGVVAPLLTVRAARMAEVARQSADIDLAASALHLLQSAPELAVAGRLGAQQARLEGIEKEISRTQDAAARPAAIAAALDNLAMTVAVLCGFLIGVPLVVSGDLWDVNLAVLVLAPLAAFEGTALLAPAAVQLVHSAGAATRLLEMLGTSGLEQAAEQSPQGQVAAGSAPAAARDLGDNPVLEAQGLAVGWPGGPVVAEGIDLRLEAGGKLAIVGPSGIGKSTLLYTLAGLIPPRGGRLTLGGVELSELDRATITRHLTMTAEDAHLFYTSVLENLRVARGDLSPEQATTALEKAGLGAWLAALPEGLDTQLGAEGQNVSGGERRRLLLARALSTPSELLLLDEPGEHLDAQTADRLVRDLLRGGDNAGRGVLLVTHRLSALDEADEVLVLGTSTDLASELRASSEAERLGLDPQQTELAGAAGGGENARPEPDSGVAGGAKRKVARVIARGSHSHLQAENPAYAWAVEQERAHV